MHAWMVVVVHNVCLFFSRYYNKVLAAGGPMENAFIFK